MIDSVFLDTVQLTAPNRFVLSIRNGGFPDIDYSSVKKGGYTGRTISPGKFISYKFVIEWNIVGSSFSDLANQREAFISLLGNIVSAGGKRLKINKANGINVYIDIKGIDVLTDVSTSDPLNSRVLTEMEAEYPFLRSQTPSQTQVSIFSGGGMPIPMPIPMPMNAGGAGEAIILNNGNYEAYPIFTFTGPLSNPTLTNLTTGKTITLNFTLNTGSDIIEIDVFGRGAVFRPSGANARQYISGDFWTLAVGSNIVHLGNASFNPSGKCIVDYADTYLGI